MGDDRGRDTVTIDLEGKDFDPRALADAIIAIERIVKSFDHDMRLEPHGRSELGLQYLWFGSAHVTISAPSDDIDTLQSGLDELSLHPAIPPGWSRKGVEALVDLGKVKNKRGIHLVALTTSRMVARIDDVIQRNAEKALAPATVSLGAVRGVLYRYTNDETTSHRSAALRDYRTEDVVAVNFPAELAGQFKQSLDAEVEVWGEVSRDEEGRLLKIRAEGVEILNHAVRERGAGSVMGLFGPDWTDGHDPVDWVRTQRD
ncbi:hypothetical protein C5E45_18885 [Nocardia nova]|uniref:Uncharacterized protein n=1 Tax=Nocardia nova TaxID=37330 RepID=A0A2S6ANR5_9NOCA|nr:hypothetical protein [Nocardia nova]PPJ25163.1 hypothetical protein C5E41_20160 [Nocardia nova]PPJ36860.1 hypothetical protein C5E45_18885 [Nocardia nova]